LNGNGQADLNASVIKSGNTTTVFVHSSSSAVGDVPVQQPN